MKKNNTQNKRVIKQWIFTLLLLAVGSSAFAQTKDQCEIIMDAKEKIPQLSDSISISVSNAPFREFIRELLLMKGST